MSERRVVLWLIQLYYDMKCFCSFQSFMMIFIFGLTVIHYTKYKMYHNFNINKKSPNFG